MKARRQAAYRRVLERGFVLPVTVILLALISVGVALMAHRSDQLRALAVASRQEQQASVAAHNALAQALYLSSVMARRGSRLGDIEIDGRFYRTADNTFVSYQDAGGLFNLNRATGPEVTALLRALGVSEQQASRLSDTLLDYIDSDSLVRVNGAEASDYAAAGMAAPRNAALLTPGEIKRIAGWAELDPKALRAVLANTYIGNINAVNRHTVRAPVLAAISGADIETAQQLVAQRGPGEALNIESLPNIARGSYLSASRYIMLPSSTILLTVCPPAVAWCQRSSLTATPDEGDAPWHVDFSIRQPRIEPLPPPSKVMALPDRQPKEAPPPLWTPFGNAQ